MGYVVIYWVAPENPALLGYQYGPEREHAHKVMSQRQFSASMVSFSFEEAAAEERAEESQ